MQINKPILFIDIDTCSFDKHKPISILLRMELTKRFPDGETEELMKIINPQMPVEEHVLEDAGLNQHTVDNHDPFSKVAQEFYDFMKGCIIVGYDVREWIWPVVVEAFYKADIIINTDEFVVIDLKKEFKQREQRTLSGAYEHFTKNKKNNDFRGTGQVFGYYEREITNNKAQSAIFDAQIEKYTDLPDTIENCEKQQINDSRIDLEGKFYINEQNKVVINFGKYIGKTLRYIEEHDLPYFHWLLSTDSLTFNVKNVAIKYMHTSQTRRPEEMDKLLNLNPEDIA